MATDDQRKIRELFDSALAQPAAERLAWLRSQKNVSPETVQAVSRLLSASLESGGFLARPALRRPERTAREGRRIGVYRVVRELGPGGMGVVYLCERDDDVFRRPVAVKVMRSDYSAPGMLTRFHAERQILARLDHQNIVRIIDGGTTDDGMPYLVMDYVNGEPIDAFCNRRRATLVQRLNLMRQVCSAVTYLHANQVLHRDLKPSNIFVGNDGVVKLFDFGIAKPMNEQMEAASTQAPFMTPRYSSPEQVNSQRTTPESDVYSLGAVLYVLLTGREPLVVEGKSHAEMVRTINTQTPMPMSKAMRAKPVDDPSFAVPESAAEWAAKLRGELDTIVAMALRKEPERRYRTAAALSEDIRRSQEQEPVLARGNSPVYVASKFLARNRVSAIAALIVVAALSVAGTMAGDNYRLHRQLERIQQQFPTAGGAGRSVAPAEVKAKAEALRKDYSETLTPMLANPLAPRREMGALAEENVNYLNQLAPSVVASHDLGAARSLGDAYLAVSKLAWNPAGRNLDDPKLASETAQAAITALAPMLQDSKVLSAAADPARREEVQKASASLQALKQQAMDAAKAAQGR